MTNDLPSVGTEDARPVCNDAHQHMALVTLYALALTTGGPMGAVDQFKAIRDHVAALVSERDELASRVRELEAEVLDQCRLNGMGAERESALMGRVRELVGALAGLLEQVEKFTSKHGEADFETAEALRAVEAAVAHEAAPTEAKPAQDAVDAERYRFVIGHDDYGVCLWHTPPGHQVPGWFMVTTKELDAAISAKKVHP